MKFRQHKQQNKKPDIKASNVPKESKPREQPSSSSSRSKTKEDVEAQAAQQASEHAVVPSRDVLARPEPPQEYAQDVDLFSDLHEFPSFE
jgi:hypothetical protein